MLDTHMGEHGRIRRRSNQTFSGQSVAGGSAEHAPRHLFYSNRQHQIIFACFHAHPPFTEGCSARGTRIRAVDDGYTGLANDSQDPLTDHPFVNVAAVERLHIMDGEASIIQSHECRLGPDIFESAVRKPAELYHPDSDNIDIRHGGTPQAFTK